ncbi:glutamate synthase subunit beta [Candidatus Leptofilum sp.]|uniref:glutamate synthase subunit beta n=1 Tax=Candidatus Leptofilum sp. TaxID=3241576 RepID=UPI003B5B8BDB
MAKPTGFLEFGREAAGERPLTERVHDWEPIHLHLPEERLNQQAARCMDCGIPFCHKGTILNGMTSGCPLNNLIPEWNDLVYRGLWREAYERLSRTNNFPEFTGLVCPAPCEAACTLGIHDPAVTIKQIEFAIIERAFDEGWVLPNTPAQRTGKTVAIIGSGPAGLAAADELNKAGHTVTVYERADRIGGLLMYGIPNMKLDKKLVQRRIDLLAEAGIQFVTNCEVGRDVTAVQLQNQFDAIVLCTGATQPNNLPVPGRELNGIHFAMEFLQGNTQKLLDGAAETPAVFAGGKDVIVIGGGDTGTDCVATALRHGCDSLVQFEIMDQPPVHRAADNPWPQWPRVYKMDYGQEEATAVFGEDPREYAIMTKRFIGDEQGNLQAVETVNVRWLPAENGSRPQLEEIPGTEQTWAAQLVLLALGFRGPEQTLAQQFGVETGPRTNIATQNGSYATNVPGVFAAGDARRGQSLVVWAINEGRGVGTAVDTYLMAG